MTLITPDFGIIFWQSTTFLVVLFLLSKFAWRPILQVVQARENEVAGALDKIHSARTLVKQLEDDRAKLIKETDLERERIIGQALATQRLIIEQANKEALAAKEALLRQAKIDIRKEQERASAAVRANIGTLVIQVAEKLLVKELSQDLSQWALIERLMAGEKSSKLV